MNIALVGYGKMGKAIEEIALSKGHQIGLKISSANLHELNPENLRKIDVAIEFTRPETAFENIKCLLENKVPVVCGTTAWLDKKVDAEEICRQQDSAFLYASNFSIGVNLFFELNKQLAQLMNKYPQYEASVEEIHHTAKLDAPSGTAVTLAEGIIEHIDAKNSWSNESSTDSSVLSIISKREDPAPGTHRISYDSEIDSIEMIHTAHSRKGFASGAVLAAEFLVGKSGIFTMKDVLF